MYMYMYNMYIAAATTQITKVTYLGTLLCLNAILISQISAHPPILAHCKVHPPWAIFREDTIQYKSL